MWQTLESDPGLFTELVEKWGVENVEFNEIFGIDETSFQMLEADDIYGVVFLFNHSQQPQETREPNYDEDAPVFFANQVVENSCASQALLGLVLSMSHQLKLSDELQQLKDFCEAVDPEMRGEIIGSSEFLRQTHNSMCSSPSFIEETDPLRDQQKTQDAFHYVAFVPVAGSVYELDGLRKAAINHGSINEKEGGVIGKLSEVLQRRVSQFGDSQLGFSVMVATNDLRKSVSHASDTHWQALQTQKRASWARENKVRQFQFTGLAIELLKQIA